MPDDMRLTMAVAISNVLRAHFVGREGFVQVTETTSECPLVELTLENGERYNVTITKARTRK